MMTANVSCGRAPKAFLAILEPKSQGWVHSGVTKVTHGQGHQTKGWILDGRNKFCFVLKVLTSGENRTHLANSGKVAAQGLVRFHRVEIFPGAG
jgi:hypothetical protein